MAMTSHDGNMTCNPQDIQPIDDPIQTQVLQAVKICLQKCDYYYNTENKLPVENAPDEQEIQYEEEDEEKDAPPDAVRNTPQPTNSTIDWKKFVLVTGKAGTGKTHCLLKAINESLEDERQILIVTPTGLLGYNLLQIRFKARMLGYANRNVFDLFAFYCLFVFAFYFHNLFTALILFVCVHYDTVSTRKPNHVTN